MAKYGICNPKVFEDMVKEFVDSLAITKYFREVEAAQGGAQ